MFRLEKTLMRFILAAVFASGSVFAAVAAAEVPVGTVISSENIDQIYDDTFQGFKIKDLLTEHQEMWIRDYGLTMKLGPTTELHFDPAWLAARDKNRDGHVTLDPSTKRIKNWTVGMPFPDVDVNDPDCGWKLAWNHYYSNPIMGNSWMTTADIYIIDAKRGVIDNIAGHSGKLIMEGRTRGEPRIGAPNEHARYLVVIDEPYDIAGVGIFNQQYNDGTLDDAWVYLKSLRRVRRVAGGKTWMDPQPKMDRLNDDNQAIQGFPGWFKNWECKGKRHVLEVVTAPDANRAVRGKIDDRVNLKEPPYWNPINLTWEPREVYVLEATPPDEHPYGKKVLFMDVNFPFAYHVEDYDKKGQFWKYDMQAYGPYEKGTCDGAPGVGFSMAHIIDFQALRATYIHNTFMASNCFDLDFYQPSIMAKGAAGYVRSEVDRVREERYGNP